MEVITPRWIENMLLYAMQSHTGAVGIKLLYPNNTLQHGGIAITPTGETYHIDAHKSANDAGYNGSQTIATNLIAVTAACLMVSKQKYQQVHGMDETLAIEYNDIDFCIKLYKAGYYNVYLPYITMYHHESATRGHPLRNLKAWQQHEKEHAYFLGKVKGFLGEDPYCYC